VVDHLQIWPEGMGAPMTLGVIRPFPFGLSHFSFGQEDGSFIIILLG